MYEVIRSTSTSASGLNTALHWLHSSRTLNSFQEARQLNHSFGTHRATGKQSTVHDQRSQGAPQTSIEPKYLACSFDIECWARKGGAQCLGEKTAGG